MRFLAVYSTTLFQVESANSEVCSKFSEKKQEKFFSHAPLQITKKPQKPLQDALSNTLHRPRQTEGRNTFFHFFIKDLNKTHKKMIPKKIADFIIAVTGNRIPFNHCAYAKQGLVPYSVFEASKGQDRGLHRCPVTAIIKLIRKDSKVSSFCAYFIVSICYFVVSYVKRK